QLTIYCLPPFPQAHSWQIAEDSTVELLVSPTEEQLISVNVNETNLASHCDPPELHKMQETQEITVTESTPPANNPADKTRRYSVRSRRIFDECFEMVDRNFFASDRKVGALDGFYFASFSVDSALRSGPPSQINLVEDQCVECLNADNPDCWVAKVHPILNRSASSQKRGRRDSALPDSPVAKDNPDEGAPTNGLYSPQTNGHSENERPSVGRVNSVCLTRILRGTAKGKRDPRELFREEVITISNKQQESKMKRRCSNCRGVLRKLCCGLLGNQPPSNLSRYALTELIETEREYVKALTPLLDALTRFGTRVTLHLGEATEETIDLPKPLQQCIRNLRDKLKKIIDFTEKTLLDELAACTMNPPSAAECFIRNAAALEHYSIYLLHLDAFVKQLTLTNGPDSDALFVLQDSSSPPRSPTENGDSTSALCNQRKSITYKYLLELLNLPKLRLLAYRVLLRDVARYTSQAGASTEQLEHGMTVIARASRRTEESLLFWTKINQTTSECVEWINMYKNKRIGNLMPPALVRLTDLETNIRTGLRPNAAETKKGRLILLPQHILFLQQPESIDTWDISWIMKVGLDGLRIGASELSDKQPPWFEIWNTEGSDPTKKIVRIYCADTLSQDAWMEDIRRALMNLLQCGDEETHVDGAVVSAHEEADLRKRLKFAHVMELPAFRSDSLEDFFVDALEDLQKQQATFSSVDDTHNGQKPQVLDLASMSMATSKKQDSSTSSSYHTAEEPSEDHQTSCAKETSTTLYESYTTLDDVRTPFSEDQRSMFEDNLENKEDSMPLDAPPGAVVKTLTVGAGEQIQFNASFTISGPIAYEVTWMMNGLPIPPTIDADMILSDTDTRLLIGHADPAVHSGTYACRCRLFDGTQTAVYFYVNVVPKEPELSEDDEEQAEQQVTVSEVREPAYRESISPAVVLTPVARQLDIPIGQVLELAVEVQRDVLASVICNFKGIKDKKAVQPVLVDWYHDDVLLQPSSNCIMSQKEAMATLQTVTTNFMPDQQSEYKCVLRLPNEYSEAIQLSTSIIVHFHEPTQEELASGFAPVASLVPPTYESLPKAVSISDLIDIQLIQGQRFHLVAPFDLQSANDDLAIWWTHNDEIIASRNFDMDNVKDFKCLLNKNNQTIKLVKPTAEKDDVGLYTCWVSDAGEKKNGQKCIEYAVDILESDSELDSEIRSQLEDELSQFGQESLNEEVFLTEQTDESLEEQSDVQNHLELKQSEVCGETDEDEQQHVQLTETPNLEEEFGYSDQKQPQHTVDADDSEWSKPVEEQSSYRDQDLVHKGDSFEESTKKNEEISEKSGKENLSTAYDDRQNEGWMFTEEARDDRLINALEQTHEVVEDGPYNGEQWQQETETVRAKESDKTLKQKETSISENRNEDEDVKCSDGSKLETEDRTCAEEEQKRKAEEEQFRAEERNRQEEEKLFVLAQLKQMTEDVAMIQMSEDGQYVGKQVATESEWALTEGEIEPQREEEDIYCDNREMRQLADETLEDEKELDNTEMSIGGESDEGKHGKKEASAPVADRRSKNGNKLTESEEVETIRGGYGEVIVMDGERKLHNEEETTSVKEEVERNKDEGFEEEAKREEEKTLDDKTLGGDEELAITTQLRQKENDRHDYAKMDERKSEARDLETGGTRVEEGEEAKLEEERRCEAGGIQWERKVKEEERKNEAEEEEKAKLEEEKKQKAEEDEMKAKLEDEEKKRKTEEEKKRKSEEEEKKRKAEEEEKKRKAEEEEMVKLMEEETRRKAEEEEKKRSVEEEEEKRKAEEEKKRKAQEEEKAKLMEEEKKRKAEEEEEKRKAEEEKRKADEEEKKRKAEEEKKRKAEEEEKKRKAEEEKKRKAEEEEKKRKAEEEKKRKAEEEEKKRKAEEEKKRKVEEEEKRRKAEEEEEKKRKAEEEEKKRRAEEKKRNAEEEERKRKAEEEEKKRKAEEEEKKRRAEEKKRNAEEEERKRKAEEEEKKRKAEEKKRKAEEEEEKRKAEEEKKRKAKEEENMRNAEEEKKRKLEEEKRKVEEEERKRKAEEEERKRKAEEEEKKRKAEEEEKKRRAEEKKRNAEEEERKRKAEEEEKKRKAEEEEKKRRAEEKKRNAEEEERKRKAEEEEKKRKAEEEEKKRRAEEKKRNAEEEERKRKAEEEEKKRKAEEEEKKRRAEEKKRNAEEEEKKKRNAEEEEEEEKNRKAEEEERKSKAAEQEEKTKLETKGKKRKAKEEKVKLAEECKRKINETVEKHMDEQKTEIMSQEEAQSKISSSARTEGVVVEGFDIVDFERGADVFESPKQKNLTDVLEEEMEEPDFEDEEFNRKKYESRKQKEKKHSEKSDAASMNMSDSRGMEFAALSNAQITGLPSDDSDVPADKVYFKTFEADSVKEATTLAKGQLGEETIEKRKDRKRRTDVDTHEKKVGNRKPSKGRVDQLEVVTQQGNQAEAVKDHLEETTFRRLEEKPDIAPHRESVDIVTSHEMKGEDETRSGAENEYIKTIGQEADSRPLLFTIEHKTSELERAEEHVQQTDDSICIPLAEAVALSGQSLLSAVKGHSFKISVTDLPNIPLKLSWYLNDELITEDELLPPGTNGQNGVVDVCHMPSATLYIRNLTEADTGIYHLKIVDLEGNADEALGPLATVDVPVKLKKRARDKVKRSKDIPATIPFEFEKLRCTDLSTPIIEGSNVELVARFPTFGLDYDENDFQWLVDGKAVSSAGPLVRVDTDPNQGHVSLVIPNIQPEHEGIYSIRFSDNARKRIQDNVPANLPMGDLSKALVFPPLVILKKQQTSQAMGYSERWQPSNCRPSAFDRELPPSTSIKEGEHAKLEARLGRNHEIFGHEWLVNGKPILPEFTSDYTIWRADNLLALTIPRMRRDLAGIYELRVFGEQDLYTTSTELIVEPSRAKTSSYKLTSADGLKPLFTKRLQDYEVDVGDCVRFTARVMAEPPAVIVWKHNGNIVTGDHRIKLFNDDANPSLTIRHARPEDRGRYCCIATNALGRVDTEGVLQVHDTDRYVPLGDEFDAAGSLEGRKEIGGSKRTALPRTAPEVALASVSVSNIDLRWKPIQSDEGVTYIVELSKDGGKWWKPIITSLRETHASISEELASPLEPVQLRVVGENEFGTGPASTPPVRIPARACIPTMPQVKPDIEFEEAASVLIKWPKATASIMEHTLLAEHVISPSAMLGQVWYAVEVREGAQSEWRRVATNLKNQCYTYHLRPGASTAIRVVAANRFGESSPTPIGLAHLDPNTLAPNLDFNPPWVSLNRPVSDDGPTYEMQPLGVTVHWKPAYMPEFCSSCVRGLEPMYRLEWRRGRSGMWQALADDLTDPDAGFRLPTDLVLALQDDAKRMKDSRSLVALNSQAIELRLFCWNKYGESGPTKPCRLVASQLFRGQLYKNSTVMDKDSMQLSQITDVLQELDQLPVMSANDRCSRLLIRISSLSTTEGIGLSWEKFTLTGLPKASGDQPPEPHGRYRIEKYTAKPSSPMDSPNTNQTDWKLASLDAAVIYGEDFILDTRPDKEEQIYRLLALNETETCSMWVDGYNRIRIPPLSELVPAAPTDLTIQCVPVNDSTISAENHITWKPANQHPLLVELSPSSELVEARELANPPLDLRYRIEARSTLSELSPWRQVAEVYGGTTSAVDRKAEPGLALIYRITPINRFGEGSSVTSPPIRTPILYSALEGCIEDVRYVILGPTEFQLRWRLGDAAIDALKHDQPNTWGRKRSLCRSGSVDYSERVSFTVEVRGGYAGDWSPAVEEIQGDLNAKALLQDCHYLDHDISCRIVALIDGQRSPPSRPIRLNVRADAMTPDYTFVKPKVHVETVEEYVISWDEPDVQEIYSSHTLGLTTPQTLQKEMNYAVQVQREGKPQWETIATQLKEPHYTWAQPNPLQAYHVRVLPANQFGTGIPSRSIRVEPQVVIPDLSFIRPSIEAPADILAGSTAPELVWQLPRAYSLEKTLTPVTYEVQVRGVANASRLALSPVPRADHSASRQSAADDDETVWRVLETNVKRTRLPLGRLDPEQEFWLRIVAVTAYGRGAPSQSVRKLVDLAAKRQQRMSASIVTIHEATPVSPTFVDPKGTVLYAPVGGRLELRSNLQTIQPDADIRFSWSLNGRPIEIPESAQQNRLSRYQSYVSKTSDVAVLQVHNLTESDFGVYICKAVNIRGSTTKEFIVKKADAPVFLEVPVPVMTVKLHCSFELPCWVDAVPTATLYWTRDSKRVVESHRTKIGSRISRTKEDAQCFTINASLSVDRCIYQDAGLYTLVAENIAGRVQTSCLIRIEGPVLSSSSGNILTLDFECLPAPESPIPKSPTLRWTDVGLHYYVLRRLDKGDVSELRLLIDKQTNQEYVGKLYFLDDPIGRVAGAREFECLSRLCHSNVVQLHDAIVSDNVLVLIMERLTGPNLLKAMLHCNNWSEYATASVVKQVLEAVQHLHSECVVHLDLQPENLLFARNVTAETWDGQTSYTDLFKALSPLVSDTMGLRETDRHKMSVLSSLIKLVGFSSAEPLVNKSNAGPVYCYPPQRFRPEYSAPEVLIAASQSASTDAESPISVGPAADMWSVGVLTYVLLTGWCPFFDVHSGEPLREQILNANFSMDLSEFDSISDNAKQFIRDLLQPNPGSRPTAAECLQHPWLSTLKNSDGQNIEYRLERLPVYYEAYKSKRPCSSPPKEKQPTHSEPLSPTDIDRSMLDSTLSDTHLDDHPAKLAQDVRQRIRQLSCGPAHGEGNLSDISSRASSIPSFSDVLDPHETDSEITGRHGHIPSMDDASLELRNKLTLLRQDTLTDAVPIEDEVIHENGIEEAGDETEKKITSKSTKRDSSSQSLIPAAAPTFASPLRDAYFNIHSGEARFSCQLAGFAHLPPGIHGHREAIADLYPTDVVNAQTGHSSATVAAWYLGGCLLSDGPGVQLGTGPGGWLWLYLSELNVDQAGTVVKCVVRNRAGKAKTQARLLIADPPKPPGRPGMAEVHPTEALITWAPSDVDVGGDLIYRVDAKFAANNGPAAWHTLGFTVDCRFLAMNLQPGLCYRMRVSAGNCCGWGNYSIASSEFYTPTDYPSLSDSSKDRSSEVISLLSKDDREWLLTWRQSTDIYALSEHPVAVQFGMALGNVVPLPVSDKSLQKLQCHDGLITDLEVLREVCTPEYLVYRGKFSKMLVARTNPMLTDRGEAAQDQLILPPRLFLRITEISGDDECTEQRARKEAILMTGLNTSSGGMFASVDDYFSGIDNSYLFTAARHLLPCGASLAWLTNDAVKPSIGVSVSYWIPGGQLFDVLVSRTEYTEFSIMRWTQQLLMALRWLYSKLFGRPHGAIIPRHILAARRSSTLPDIVLTGFGGSNEEINGEPEFTAPEVSQGEPLSVFSDLWSIGALNYLLMTGNCPDAKLAEATYKILTETTTDEEKPKPTGHQGDPHKPHYIDFKKLHMFSKPAKKFVYNCLQPVPKKRGHIDFWLESRWFDISTENVQRLTRTPIPISQLNAYRLRHTDPLRSRPSADASDIQLP
ncbi:hypothetical protein T265_12500, partial [Opisthorchis viverrini]